MEELLTTEQIAEILKLNVVTIRRYIKSGKLKAAYFGKEYRVSKSDFESFVDQHRGKRK